MDRFVGRQSFGKLTQEKKVAQLCQKCSDPVGVGMDRFFIRRNVGRYRILANKRTNATERLQILKLLAEEEAKFKLEFNVAAAK